MRDNNILETKTEIHLSEMLYGYICYLAFLSIADIFALVLYYSDNNKYLSISIVTSIFITIFIFIYFKRFITFSQKRFSVDLLPYFMIIICIALLRGMAPDFSHDVSKARIYWQTPGFVDNVNINVFPAGFTFFFPLSDRAFYYPRMLLGFRMGTLFNAFLLILIMCQVRCLISLIAGKHISDLSENIAEEFNSKFFKRIAKFILSEETFSFFAVTSYYMLADLGTYMIDLVAIPILLWLLCHIIGTQQNDATLPEMLFVAWLCGLSFALKFTNVIFIAPMLLLYLWQNRRAIKPFYFFACLLIGLIPSIGYMFYAYTSTGNPVYWTFNSIFKSPYYHDVDFKDMRWGPQDWMQFVLWPIHIILHPEKNVTEISSSPQCFLLLGYIGSVYCFIASWKKRHPTVTILSSLFFIFTFLWLKSTGYARYANLCEILSIVLILLCTVDLLNSDKKWKIAISSLLFTVLISQACANLYGAALNHYDWSFRERISKQGLSDYQKENIANAFRDHGNIGTEEQREKIDVFFSAHERHSLMILLDDSAPIINGNYIVSTLSPLKESKNIDYYTYYFNQIKQMESEKKGIYDISIARDYDNFCSNANLIGAEIVSLEEVPSYFIDGDIPILIGYSLTGKENTCTDMREPQIFTIPQGTTEVTITGIVCLPSYVQWDVPNAKLQISAERNGETTVLRELDIPQKTYIKLNETLNVSTLSSSGDISITLADISGATWVGNVINLEVTEQ